MNESWALGALLERIELRGTPSSPETAADLQQAAEVVGYPRPLTLQQLRDARGHMLSAEGGVLARLRGFLSVSNLLHLLSLVAVLATAGPFAVAIGYQLGLGMLFVSVFKALFSFVFETVVPLLLAVYRSPPSRLLRPAIALLLLGAQVPGALQYRDENQRARSFWLIALGVTACVFYRAGVGRIAFVQAAAGVAACAVLGDSTLLAYCATGLLMGALGFFVASIGCGYVVGFTDESAVGMAQAGSGVLLVAAVLLRAVAPALLQQYRGLALLHTPVVILGAVVFYTSLQVQEMAHRDFGCGTRRRSGACSFAARRLVSLLLLIAGVTAGSLLLVPSLANTALVFLGMWALDVTLEIGLWKSWFLMIFGVSLLAYRATALLASQPAILLSFFDVGPRSLPAEGDAVAALMEHSANIAVLAYRAFHPSWQDYAAAVLASLAFLLASLGARNDRDEAKVRHEIKRAAELGENRARARKQ